MIEKFEIQLNELKINTIKNYDIKNNNDILTITIENNNNEKLIIRFKEVNGYSFQNFEGLNDIKLEPISQNLDFISYYRNGFARFSEINYLTFEELRSSIPNFAINLIDSSIYVDANIIEINGEEYQVNYYN